MNALKNYSTCTTEAGILYSSSICARSKHRWKENALKELKELLRPSLSLATIRLLIEKIPDKVVEDEYGFCYLPLEICRQSEMATEQLTLNDTFWHNDRGNDWNYEEEHESGQVLFGEATFGENFSREYYYNGNLDRKSSCETKTSAKFPVEMPLVALIKRIWKKNEEEEITYRLFVYIPQ